MKAILVFDDMPSCCTACPFFEFINGDDHDDCRTHCIVKLGQINEYGAEVRPKWCPLKHPLKYASNDFYIYDTKYLMENLDREINLLKGTKAYKEFMEKQNVQVSYVNLGETE